MSNALRGAAMRFGAPRCQTEGLNAAYGINWSNASCNVQDKHNADVTNKHALACAGTSSPRDASLRPRRRT
eukprot:2118718-Pyramimonas_sp.AAC.1